MSFALECRNVHYCKLFFLPTDINQTFLSAFNKVFVIAAHNHNRTWVSKNKKDNCFANTKFKEGQQNMSGAVSTYFLLNKSSMAFIILMSKWYNLIWILLFAHFYHTKGCKTCCSMYYFCVYPSPIFFLLLSQFIICIIPFLPENILYKSVIYCPSFFPI